MKTEKAKTWNGGRPEPVAAEIEENDGPTGGTVERHPAYAQIVANRVSGRAYLYGSDFAHQHFVTISVCRSELHRTLSNDWPHGLEELIEVALSEAQWAAFVSSMNVGAGVQCTLWHDRGALVPGLRPPRSRAEQFGGELGERFKNAGETLRALRERIATGKGGKESLALLDKALQEIGSNAGFVVEQFDEHVERTVERAKIEVNAHAQATISRLGLAAAAVAPIELGEGSERSR